MDNCEKTLNILLDTVVELKEKIETLETRLKILELLVIEKEGGKNA